VTATEIEGYRQKLLALGRRMEGDVTGLAGEAFRTSGGEASGNLSNTPLHLADLSTDHFNQELSVCLLEAEGQTLEEIAAALTRIERGGYGHCEQCAAAIPPERLEAVPYTRHCIRCARTLERDGLGMRGPSAF
jgi:RNA polymerase-binding transcription factor DksA